MKAVLYEATFIFNRELQLWSNFSSARAASGRGSGLGAWAGARAGPGGGGRVRVGSAAQSVWPCENSHVTPDGSRTSTM